MKENQKNTAEFYGKAPTKEEVAQNFQHSKDCTVSTTLKVVIRRNLKRIEGPFSAMVEFTRETKTYLACDECGVEEMFIN